MSTKTTIHHDPSLHRPHPESIISAIAKRSYCTLATVSEAGCPHAAGVLYELVDDAMWINTISTSRKARNIAVNGNVGVVVPVRRVPFGGPPSSIQFQSPATIVDVHDPQVGDLLERGALSTITGHGELDLGDNCFVRVPLPRRLHTYGLGMSIASLVRHPLDAAGIVER